MQANITRNTQLIISVCIKKGISILLEQSLANYRLELGQVFFVIS